MSDIVVDSCVVAKWILPEADSLKALQLLTEAASNGSRLVVLDLVFAEVANVIWKRLRQKHITPQEARAFLQRLMQIPAHVEPAAGLIEPAFEIAAKYDRSIYDALFVALARDLGARGVTADEPIFNAVRADIPGIVLLRNWA